MHKAIAAAIAAGLATAAAWAAVAYFSGWSFGFLALLIGLAVGVAFRVADHDRTSNFRGFAAGAIAFASVFVGKFAVAHAVATATIAESLAESEREVSSTDDPILMDVADQIIARREEAGIESDWPEDDSDEPSEYYPADVWAQAQSEFYNLSEADQQVAREEYRVGLAADAEGSAAAVTLLFFLFSFRLLDLVWLCMTVGTAYKIASGRDKPEEPLAETQLAPHFSSGSPLRGMPPAAAPTAAPRRDAA